MLRPLKCEVAMNDEVMRVAEALGAEDGRSMSELAKAMGISRATLHRRFGTREALELWASRHALEWMERRVTEACERPTSASHSLSQLVSDCVAVAPLYRLLCKAREAEIVAAWAEAREGLVQLIGQARSEGALRVDMPAEWLAAVLDSLICVAAGPAFREVPRDQVVLMVWQTFLHGAAGT